MPTLTLNDGTELYYKDWGSGPPVVFSHGWPLSSDSWESQMMHVASNGYRAIAMDRRGHGRSSQPWDHNTMDQYADDLGALLEHLDLRGAALIGFSTGGGEVARYIGRHGARRVAKVALIAAVTPFLLRTAEHPEGVPLEKFDELREASLRDRAQLYLDLASGPFFGFNRSGAKVSQGWIAAFVAQGLQAGHKSAFDCIAAFSESDFREDLGRFTMPTLIVHGDDDQIVPLGVSAIAAAKLVPHAELKIYEGAPHGLADTHKDRLNRDLLEFLRK
jgi:non-heme chloroperoxidase